MKRVLSAILVCLASVVLCFGQQGAVNAQAVVKGRSVQGTLPRPSMTYNGGVEGVIVVSVKVDQYGNVTEAVPGAEGTTVTDKALWNAVRNAALKTHFNQSANAPAIQRGVITYRFGKEQNGDPSIDREEQFTPVKDLVLYHESGVFRIKARYVKTHNMFDLIFSVEEDDYEIPIRFMKKDLGAEKRFRALNLHPGDTLMLEGKLVEIYVGGHGYKGLTDAVILDRRAVPYANGEDSKESNQDVPFQIIDQKPSFNGGDIDEFSKWVHKRLQYPTEKCGQGRVFVQFTIKADGSVTNVKVVQGVDPDFDKEAVRVVSSSPRWKPGMSKGKAVDVTYTFPVIFQLR